MNDATRDPLPDEGCIAIVGMACHFPDARTPEAFWQNLASGRESVRDYDEASLRAAGVAAAELADPAYVRAGLPLEGFDQFDAAFFGLSPGEAKVMDPQHRRFLECAWLALEDAGHTPASVGRNIGVFAGSGMHWYLLRNLMSNPELIRELGEFQVRHTANDKDFLATRVSYHLDLRGPSINVQTACSTSLVAVHLACQSLLNGESDMALAGGSTIEVPHRVGYRYREEEVRSPDGRCRAMDADAGGTAFGSGCGVVVLRRLRDALADGDCIRAVIRGSAVNNDGAAKAGYFAPSVDGQAQAIAEAIAVSGVAADSIGYVEAHGTGTRIGDPIEIAALTRGFGPTARRQYCALGSVKTNIGHLDTAAGVAGLIKVALSMQHRKLPPSLNFRTPNPEIDFAASPFHVNAQLADWPDLGAPRRAGISALGVGGTNAHLILEEAPTAGSGAPPLSPADEAVCILPLSARTPAALAETAKNLHAHLSAHPELALRDVAWTLREGRVAFAQRVAVAGRDRDSLLAQLRGVLRPVKAAEQAPKVVFMFPGQGSQYPNMARRLYATDADFRAAMEACFSVLRRIGRSDAIAALYPAEVGPEAAAALRNTAVTQPVLFCIEYALATALIAKGVRPGAMIGHSLGEYVAACLAGIFTLDAALRLVCRRGELIAALPPGAMLSIAADHRQIRSHLSPGLALAGINGPESCVVAGATEAIAGLAEHLVAQGIAVRRLETSHAFHSPMLDPIVAEFRAAVEAAAPAAVDKAMIISNVSGTWLSATQAGSAGYWASHLRQPVDFAAGIGELRKLGSVVFVEVGPGNTLSSLTTAIAADARVVTTLPHPRDTSADDDVFAAAGGMLWAHGLDVDWKAWRQPQSGGRVALPGYPFQRQRHWVEPGPGQAAVNRDDADADARLPFEDWFNATDWRSTLVENAGDAEITRVLVFAGTWGVAGSLLEAMRERGTPCTSVEIGAQFSLDGDRAIIDPACEADWDMLASTVGTFSHVIYLWPVDTAMASPEKSTAACFDHLLRLGKRIEHFCDPRAGLKLIVATANAHQLGGEGGGNLYGNPYQALVSGPVLTLPQENPAVRATWVDFDAARIEWATGEITAQLQAEMAAGAVREVIAWRHRRRMRRVFTRLPSPLAAGASMLREGACYLVTGAFGGAGQALARYLAQRYRARLLLVGRSELPPPEQWDHYLAGSQPGDPVRRRIQMVRRLGSDAASVQVLSVDVADGRALARAVHDLGVTRIDGIFHAAGVLDDAPMALKSVEAAHRVLHPKVAGALGLQSLRPLRPEFVLYFSSVSAQSAVAGQVDYTSANAFLDAYAAAADAKSAGTRHVAVGWSIWRDAGMAAILAANSGLAPGEPEDADLTGHSVLTWKTIQGDGRRCFSGMLTAQSVWYMDQHRLKSGAAIMPGTGYMELIGAALRELHGGFVPMRIVGLTLGAPLVLGAREKRLLQVQLSEPASGRYALVISSQGADPGDVLDHAAAELSLELPAAELRAPGSPPAHSPAPVAGPYRHPALDFGPRWDCLTRMEAAAGEACLHLDLKTPDDLQVTPLHPALLDMAIGAAQQVLSGSAPGDPLLPFSYGEIRVRAPLARSVISHVRARPGSDRLTLDVQVRAADGRLLLEIDDFVLRRAPAVPAGRTSGPSTEARRRSALVEAGFSDGLSNEEAMAVIESALAPLAPSQMIIATRDLGRLIEGTGRGAEPTPEGQAADAAAPTYLPRPDMSCAYVAPASELQAVLVASWEAMLEIRGIGIDDDFFELGGNSLMLTRLLSRLARQQGIPLPLEQALNQPTIVHWSALATAPTGRQPVTPVKAITRVDRNRYRVASPSSPA